jgi:hypothetical protein
MTAKRYPSWYDEVCPHCKSGRLKGECDSTLREEIARLQPRLDELLADPFIYGYLDAKRKDYFA